MEKKMVQFDITIKGDAGSAEDALGRIDKYELVKELGEGGFGAVYLARDTVAGVDVAIKGLPPEVKHNAVELESIRGNFALVKRLRHPNIVAVTDLHQALAVNYASKEVEEKLRVFDRDTMVVMDYAPGATLAQWRKQFPDGKVPLEKAIAVVRQVASALDYAHGQKVLHRDVKPANVMVETMDGGKLVARVLDFGLAAEIRSSMGRVSREIRDTSGTRPYMAPEQWKGERQGPATDQYALAAMFYELVVGEVPFASVFDCGDPAVMRLVVTTDAPAIPAAIPKCVRKALVVALAKKPEERFASCGEFVAALEGKKTVGRRAPTPPSRKGGFGKALGVVALLAALAGGAWWFLSGTSETSVPPAPPKPPVTPEPPPKPLVTPKPPQLTNSIPVATPVVPPVVTNNVDVTPPPDVTSAETNDTAVVDPELVSATNRLADLIRERDRTYSEVNGTMQGIRESPRGFKAHIRRLDEVWKKRFVMHEDLTLRGAKEAVRTVSDEIAAIEDETKWIAENIKLRDDAVAAERDLAQYVENRKREYADIFNRASKEDGWEKLNDNRTAASRQIDAGKFDAAIKSFGSIKPEFENAFAEAKRKSAADRERAAHTALMARLDREGFIVDEENNPRRAGTVNRLSLPGGVSMEMVWCPPGWFMMGSPIEEMGRDSSEGVESRHGVRIQNGFWIGKYEVTKDQWKAVMGKMPENQSDADSGWFQGVVNSINSGQKPITGVSHGQCEEFCRRLPKEWKAGLPTEAEWEYACRAGTQTAYSLGRLATGKIINSNMANVETFGGFLEVVGRYKDYSNMWGICDMHGNAREWCADGYGLFTNVNSLSVNPLVNPDSFAHVVRGGACNESLDRCRCAARSSGKTDQYTGFRIRCYNLP